MVTSFNKTFLDIINCNIPNKEATINEKDAPWITAEVKQAIKKKHRIYSKWKQAGKPDSGKDIVNAVNEDTDKKQKPLNLIITRKLRLSSVTLKMIKFFGLLLIVWLVIKK